jgi:hypothetical protein
MVPYRYDPEHIAPANAAPRCQHIKMSGQRCGAPALRHRRYCYFHEQVLRPKSPNFRIHFIEDAASLQHAIMQVLRLIHSPAPDYKACALSLYALQIACMNLKTFIAEQPKLELKECEQPQSRPATTEKGKTVEEKKGDAPSLAEFLLGRLVQGQRGDDPEAPPPRIRSREDYYAALEERQASAGNFPGETRSA